MCLLNYFKFRIILNFSFFVIPCKYVRDVFTIRMFCLLGGSILWKLLYVIWNSLSFLFLTKGEFWWKCILNWTLSYSKWKFVSQHLNVLVSSGLRWFSTFMIITGKVLIVGVTDIDNMVFGLTPKKGSNALIIYSFYFFFFQENTSVWTLRGIGSP